MKIFSGRNFTKIRFRFSRNKLRNSGLTYKLNFHFLLKKQTHGQSLPQHESGPSHPIQLETLTFPQFRQYKASPRPTNPFRSDPKAITTFPKERFEGKAWRSFIQVAAA